MSPAALRGQRNLLKKVSLDSSKTFIWASPLLTLNCAGSDVFAGPGGSGSFLSFHQAVIEEQLFQFFDFKRGRHDEHFVFVDCIGETHVS